MIKYYLFLILLVFISAFAFAQPFTKQQYVENYAAMAVREMKRSGVPASITIAQGILESNCGNSILALEANNHFGIKCGFDWAPRDSFLMDDDDTAECFRKYYTVEESYADHSAFLRKRPRYAILFKLPITDFEGWAYGLKAAGYATNPKYPELLLGLINSLALHKFDLMGIADTLTLALPPLGIDYKKLPLTPFEFNRIKTVYFTPDQTLAEISKKNDIGLSRLSRYNDLTYPGAQLKFGTKIYLQPKRNKATVLYDTVLVGETLWTLSQEHGIKIKAILKKNHLTEGQELAAGQTVYLRKKRNDFPETTTLEAIEMLLKPSPDSAKTNILAPIDVLMPPVTPDTATYKVELGDTLYKISNKFYITVDKLRELNNLKDNQIKPGQVLKIK